MDTLDAGMLSPSRMIAAYAAGYFVMDDPQPDGSNTISWESPDPRAIVPLDPVKVTRWKSKPRSPFPQFSYQVDGHFGAVLEGCAALRENDLTPFMTPRVLDMYRALHAAGFAHSVEAIGEDGELLAGLLGVSIGRAWFGESTFHRASGAGTAVIIATMDLLVRGGYRLFDIQFLSDHMLRWGAHEIARDEFRRRLAAALDPNDG